MNTDAPLTKSSVHPLHDLARCPYHPAGPALAVESVECAGASEATVRCVECRRTYSVTRGVYRLMPDELRGEPASECVGGNAAFAQMRREMEQRDSRASRVTLADRPALGSPLYWMNVQYLSVTRNAQIATDGLCVDFGTGVGRYVPWILDRVGRLVATDFSLESLIALGERLSDADRARCLLVQCDVTRLPLAPGIASSGMSVEVLQHVPSAALRAAMIENMARTLRPGAPLCLVTKAYAPAARAIAPLRVLKWAVRRATGRPGERPPTSQEQHDGTIYTYWHKHAELRRLVAGRFDVARHLGIVAYGSFPLTHVPHEWALRLDAWLEPRSLGRAFGRDALLCLRRRAT